MSVKIEPDTFGFVLSDLARLMRAEMDRRITGAGIGMTPGEARTLFYVARAGEARQSVLAERMGIEAMSVSGFLDRLEARGLIERAADPSDRRAKLVRLTGAADAVLDKLAGIGAALRADISSGLTPEECERLRLGLLHMRANVLAMRPECQKASPAT